MSTAKKIIFSDDQSDAIELHCKNNGINFSDFIRQTAMQKIKRRDLIDDVKMGRPVNPEDVKKCKAKPRKVGRPANKK